MTDNEFKENEEEVWDKLFIKTENTEKNLSEIARRLLNHVKIDIENQNQIIFEKHITKIPDKIRLLLISLFVLKRKGIIKFEYINVSEMSKKISIKKTSLSKPLGILINEGYVKKDSEGNYYILHYKINEIFDKLEND